MSQAARVKLQALRTRLDEELFPAGPAPKQGLRGAEGAVLVAAVLAIGVVLQLLRLGWTASLESIWAEDGPIFLQGALAQGFFDNVLTTYAGYLVLVPRLIGEAATLVPLADAPAAISILSALVVALSGLIVWHASAGHIRNPYLRGTLAVLTVLTPVAGQEAIDSGAYAPWYMLFATFWVLLWRPRSTAATIFASLFVLATALSTPGVWFFAPLAALRALAIRDRRDLAIVGSFVTGAAVQIPVVLLNRDESADPIWTHEIWGLFVQRVLDGAAFGQRLGGIAWEHLGWPFLVVLLLGATAALAVGVRRCPPGVRYLVAIAIATSFAMFVLSVYQRAVGTQMVWPPGDYNGSASRYTIVPALLLLSAALVLADRAWRNRDGRRGAPWIATAAIGLPALALVTSFDMRDAARGTPRWDGALAEAAIVCEAERVSEVTVPISPPGFGMQVPCDRIPTASPQAAPPRPDPQR